MATISFIKSSTGYTAIVVGNQTSSTMRILRSYIERHKLDVSSTLIKANDSFPTSWENHVKDHTPVKPNKFVIRMY